MAELGVVIEAQEGLTWDRWRRIATEVERLPLDALRVTDHCMSVLAPEVRPSIQSWMAVALAAEWTDRVQLGVMMSPLTFYVPAVLARMARSVSELSGGRLVLGVGAGWHRAEHELFGIPFPSSEARFDGLESGVERIRLVLGEEVPLLVGGRGAGRTLDIAARWAAEWNCDFAGPSRYAELSRRLDERCRAVGRDPSGIRRSYFTGCLIGRDEGELRDRLEAVARVRPGLRGLPPEAGMARLQQSNWFVGTPPDVVAQMRTYVQAGAGLFVLQHLLLDDTEVLRLLAEEVLPAVRSL